MGEIRGTGDKKSEGRDVGDVEHWGEFSSLLYYRAVFSFQIYSLPLWWPVKTLLNIMLQLSHIRSPYTTVHVCNFEAFALHLSLSIFCLILHCLSKSNISQLISQHVFKTYRYRLLLKSRFYMHMYCQFEKYIPLLYEVVQFAYIKEALSYEYINTDSSYSAL